MGLLDDGLEYLRRSGRNLAEMPGDVVQWLAGGAEAGAEPLMALYRGDDIDQPLLPTAESGGKSRLGAIASAIDPNLIPGGPAGALGSYGGIRSATANKAALKTAKKMEKAGESAAPNGRIRQETGWFKDPSGDWQYEISDLNARVDPHPRNENLLQFTHPELEAAYPGITNMTIHKLVPEYEGLGWHGGGEAGIRGDLTPEMQRSVALHEIGGHAVQDREGFARGSTPSKNVARSQELTQPFFDEANRRIAAGEMTEDQAMDWLRQSTEGLTAADLYRANLGEFAARDIQARADYPDWKRQAVPPYSSEPTPPGGWIDNRDPGRSASALSTDQGEIPIGASAGTPPHPLIGQVFPDQFKASAAVMAAGGRNSGLKVVIQPDKTAIIEAAVPPAVAPGAGPVPSSSGWNSGLVAGPAPSAKQPVPPQNSVDRRGLPGRPPDRSRATLPIVDPEGRPLYADTLIAGRRAAGGPDVPLSMPEEHQLGGLLGDLNLNANNIQDKGQVTVLSAGTMDPPAPPRLKIQIKPNRPQDEVDRTARHEGGHALDYWTERTQRGTNVLSQYEIPKDVHGELAKASAEMRPDLWAPNVDQIYQRSKDVMERYRNRPDELMADGYRYYKENPAEFKAKYPNAAAYIRSQVNDDPLLSQHVQFNVAAPVSPTGLLAVPEDEDEAPGPPLSELSGLLPYGLREAVKRRAGRGLLEQR